MASVKSKNNKSTELRFISIEPIAKPVCSFSPTKAEVQNITTRLDYEHEASLYEQEASLSSFVVFAPGMGVILQRVWKKNPAQEKHDLTEESQTIHSPLTIIV